MITWAFPLRDLSSFLNWQDPSAFLSFFFLSEICSSPYCISLSTHSCHHKHHIIEFSFDQSSTEIPSYPDGMTCRYLWDDGMKRATAATAASLSSNGHFYYIQGEIFKKTTNSVFFSLMTFCLHEFEPTSSDEVKMNASSSANNVIKTKLRPRCLKKIGSVVPTQAFVRWFRLTICLCL